MRRLIPLALLLACDPADKNEPTTGDTLIYECKYTDTVLGAGDEALGTTPTAIADVLEGTTEHAATWIDGGAQTTATLDLALDLTGAMLRESPGCGDHIEIPGTASLSTADGGIDSLTVDVLLSWVADGSASASGDFEPSDVSGTWTPRALEPNESRIGLTLGISRSAGGALTATLNDSTEGNDGQVAWASFETVLELDEGFPVQ